MKTSRFIPMVLAGLLLVSSANAHPYDRHVRMAHSHGDWVVPLVVGGMLGYVLSSPRNETTYVTTQPTQVVYTSAPPARVVYTSAPASTVIYTQSAPIYEERWVYFSDCDCQRKVLVPIR
jgi:hypothetical protein